MQMVDDDFTTKPPVYTALGWEGDKQSYQRGYYDVLAVLQCFVKTQPLWLPTIVTDMIYRCEVRGKTLSERQNQVLMSVYRELCYTGILDDPRYTFQGVKKYEKVTRKVDPRFTY